MLPHAQAAASQLGVDASTLVAHAALETGWGKHVPCNEAGSSSFNLFGIKAGGDWQGKTLDAATLEFEQGSFVKKVERFRADSPADCFADYAQLLGSTRRYATARNAGSDSLQFAQGLQRGGYATDPDYASKLKAVANTVQSMKISAAQVPATSADI
jgi:flagellar protein FlgJ